MSGATPASGPRGVESLASTAAETIGPEAGPAGPAPAAPAPAPAPGAPGARTTDRASSAGFTEAALRANLEDAERRLRAAGEASSSSTPGTAAPGAAAPAGVAAPATPPVPTIARDELIARAKAAGLGAAHIERLIRSSGTVGLAFHLEELKPKWRPPSVAPEPENTLEVNVARARAAGFDDRWTGYSSKAMGNATLERFLDAWEAGALPPSQAEGFGRTSNAWELYRERARDRGELWPDRYGRSPAARAAAGAGSGGLAAGGPSPTGGVPAAAAARPGAARADGASPHAADIELGDKRFERLAPRPQPGAPFQGGTLWLQREAIKRAPALLPGFKDWWGEKEARAVLGTPALKDAQGKPRSFGDLAILRPGASNLQASAAFVFRVAQHAGKTVVAYQNSSLPGGELRPLTKYDGVDIPPELQGKIFAVGTPGPIILAPDQASDQFLEMLERMREGGAALGLDPLAAKATVLGYSEGGLDAPITRQRLINAGFPDAIGKVVAVAGGAGTATAKEDSSILNLQGKIMSKVFDTVGGASPDLTRFGKQLEPEELRKRFTKELEPLVDLSIAGTIGEPALGLGYLGGGNDINPVLRYTQVLENAADVTRDFLKDPASVGLDDLVNVWGGGAKNSDGVLSTEMTKYGRKSIITSKPHDHLGMYADPSVVDDILRGLAATPR